MHMAREFNLIVAYCPITPHSPLSSHYIVKRTPKKKIKNKKNSDTNTLKEGLSRSTAAA